MKIRLPIALIALANSVLLLSIAWWLKTPLKKKLFNFIIANEIWLIPFFLVQMFLLNFLLLSYWI